MSSGSHASSSSWWSTPQGKITSSRASGCFHLIFIGSPGSKTVLRLKRTSRQFASASEGLLIMTPSATDYFWGHVPTWTWPVIVVGMFGFFVYEAIRASEAAHPVDKSTRPATCRCSAARRHHTGRRGIRPGGRATQCLAQGRPLLAPTGRPPRR
jgi:hypothetical protein